MEDGVLGILVLVVSHVDQGLAYIHAHVTTLDQPMEDVFVLVQIV